jgi:hypothetical protein
MLIFGRAKSGVCLHYETQTNTPKGVNLVKLRCPLPEIYALSASAIVSIQST